MKIHTLLSSVTSLLLVAGLSVQAPSALASGTSSADLEVLAEKGSAMAQRVVGKRYALGVRGLERDMKKAAYWLQKAADRGDGEAQFMLGMIYSEGSGIPQDLVQAHMWLNLAGTSKQEVSQRNKAIAEHNRKAVEANMTPQQIEAAEALARDWLAKHKEINQTVASNH
ncbi:Secretory immunoglobulin A-binding protein EsiB [Rhodocyclaceae bacterium]|nr:Secretory immunoglobulin A-binding protein EsiB [Rhodocyclaceae bacterium]